jgi:hypothetical protein
MLACDRKRHSEIWFRILGQVWNSHTIQTQDFTIEYIDSTCI